MAYQLDLCQVLLEMLIRCSGFWTVDHQEVIAVHECVDETIENDNRTDHST